MGRKRRSQGAPQGNAETGLPDARVRRDARAGARFDPALRGGDAGAPHLQRKGDVTVRLLALMMFLAPALGAPNEEMLQDTLKSIVVAFCALIAALLFFQRQRRQHEPLRWHAVIWLPLALCAYAVGSMVWSHPYLGGVEAVRWFVFSLIVWLGMNTLSREKLPLLAAGIHAGAAVAALWAALQFLVDWRGFPQGPNPASTFINRNFFAEFAACTLPFGAYLLARARRSQWVALLAFTNGLVIVSILMTGTRAALMAMWLQLVVLLPLIAWRCRDQLAMASWARGTQLVAGGVLLATVLGIGMIPSGNAKILEEGRGHTAIERGLKRTQSIHPQDSSLGIRMIMWRATLNAIQARPLAGLGAGAWENEIPLYQAEGSQLETDYYVHNEYLQLVAEYGLVGWAFLLALSAWLLRCLRRSWRAQADDERADLPMRAIALCSLLALFVVSNIGFPWRMATTGALFALCLALLAASEARLEPARPWAAQRLPALPLVANGGLAVALAGLVIAGYLTWVAAESESKLVRATKMALTISASGKPNDPQWGPTKREMLRLLGEGIALNPHYRKITPMAADEIAKWGDWGNATWIWESVLGSRPHVVAILCNVARGYASTGEPQKAWAYLEKARAIQPRAPSVRSLEIILLSRAGQNDKAMAMARASIAEGVWDYDLLNAAFILGWRAGDQEFALKALKMRMDNFPQSQAAGYVQLGTFHATETHDRVKALASFRKGLAMAQPHERSALAAQIPVGFHAELGLAPSVPAGTASTTTTPQMSSSSK